ncbi:MAG: SPOR domain-containing protein [Bacteroidaceae bacterium]|nr:SPOR domain-containing protein [Bacteroidaceae bacterium]
MKNLARHIELLLRDNDCVILPDLGGFIACDTPAYYVSEEGTYYPPSRSVSFNAAIKMNDGLLAQSYMKSYQVDYARANYMIEVATEELLDTLDEEGMVTLSGLGTLRQDVYQTLHFTPEESGIDAPVHFGLGSLLIRTIDQLTHPTEEIRKPKVRAKRAKRAIHLRIEKETLRHMVSTAAVFLLLLMMAIPTGTHQTTDIASLRLTDMIVSPLTSNTETTNVSPEVMTTEAIEPEETIASEESENIATTDEGTPTCETSEAEETSQSEAIDPQSQESINTEESADNEAIETEHTTPTKENAPAPTPVTIAASNKTYHIIVASLPSHRGADETLEQFAAKGYTNVTIVERDDRVRISLAQFADKDEANEYLKELRQQEDFQNAWLLAVRN